MPTATDRSPAARDNRWKLVEATMRRHGHQGHALIETLHAAQQAYGYLDEQVLRNVSKALSLPPSKVYGVATFYNFFTLHPQGEHACVVCTGTACYIKGAGEVLAAIEKAHHLREGETTEDGKVSLLTVRCFGSCGLAPAVFFDGEVVGKLTPEGALARLARWTGRS